MSLTYPLLNQGWSFSNPVHSLENHPALLCSQSSGAHWTPLLCWLPLRCSCWVQIYKLLVASIGRTASSWDLWTLSIQEHSPEEGSGGERNKNLGQGHKFPRTTKSAAFQQKKVGNGFINVLLPRLFLIVYTTFLCHKGVVRINEIMSPLEYFPQREWEAPEPSASPEPAFKDKILCWL